MARVRDIELLTGLRFNPDLIEPDRLRVSVFLSEMLWDRIGWMDLTGTGDDECPTLGDSQNCPAGLVNLIIIIIYIYILLSSLSFLNLTNVN